LNKAGISKVLAGEAMKQTGRLFVVSGPSGSGKSTLCRAAAARTGIYLSVSATTRAPGPKEQDGRDYFYMTEAEFSKKIQAGEFLEYAKVFGQYYGTPAGPVSEHLSRGDDVLLEIDVQGGEQVFEKIPDATGIFIMPPSFEELHKRLSLRRREDDSAIERRLAQAKAEVERARAGGYYGYEVINDNLDQAIDSLAGLLQKSDSSRPARL
jgi:guanylate kinase